MTEKPSAILYVNTASSFCGECGQQTLWKETHEQVSGYGPPKKGCGARFVAVTPLYPVSEADIEQLAQDAGLPVVRSSPNPKR